MRQRIGLAQALINDPELVILDEPTSGLDPLGTRWMKDLIIELRDEGKTIIMCSHRLEDVQDICDRVAILARGRAAKLDSVKNLLEDVQRLELRATGVQLNDDLKRDLEAVLAKHGGKIEFIGHPTTTLEELFLRIIDESKAHPGRRYMPGFEEPGQPGRPKAGPTARIFRKKNRTKKKRQQDFFSIFAVLVFTPQRRGWGSTAPHLWGGKGGSVGGGRLGLYLGWRKQTMNSRPFAAVAAGRPAVLGWSPVHASDVDGRGQLSRLSCRRLDRVGRNSRRPGHG